MQTRPETHPSPDEQHVLRDTAAELEALKLRQHRRQVADAKRSWAPTVLGSLAGIIAGFSAMLSERYRALIEVVRDLRHAEDAPGRLAHRMGKDEEVHRIYNKVLANKKDKVGALLGVDASHVDHEKTFSSLFKRYTQDDYIASSESLSEALKRGGGDKESTLFRRFVDEKVMEDAHSNNIISMQWRDLNRKTQLRTVAFGVVTAVAAGAVVYGVAHWLTRESREDKKRRVQDEAMADTARELGFLPLSPGARTEDALDFRARLQEARSILTAGKREL